MIVSAQFAAKKSKELGLKRWFTIAGDYTFGRDAVGVFVEFLKKLNPDVQIAGQAWPKLGEADYTPNINAIVAAKPDVIINWLWGADITTFLKQVSMYGLLDKGKWFTWD